MEITTTAKKIRKGDVIPNERGDMRVLFNRPGPNGKRFIRTSRFDITAPNDRIFTIHREAR
jgi:hypothetical protein